MDRHSVKRRPLVLASLSLATAAGCGISAALPQPDGGSVDARAGATSIQLGASGDASDERTDGSPSDASLADADVSKSELFATIGTSLVKIDTTTGAATSVGTTNLGPVAKLAYHAGQKRLYGVFDYLKMPKLVVLDACNGQTTLVAPLTITGGSVHIAGGLDYNPSDGKLYASVSLDGAYPADGTEEHLVTIDTSTGAVTPVGQIRDGLTLIDGDNVAFSPATSLIFDIDPSDGGRFTIWDLNVADAAATNVRTASGVLSWIEFYEGVFYGATFPGTTESKLVTINPSSGALTVIGTTHGGTEFGGGPILALSEGLCERSVD